MPKPVRHLKDLRPDPDNRRAHTPRNLGLITDALHKVGAARSIVIDENNVVLAGNGTIDAAADAGITKVQVVEADGSTLIAVRRRGLTPEQKRDLALYDNRAGELAGWDLDKLREDLRAGMPLGAFFTDEELSTLLAAPQAPREGKTDPDAVPAARATDIRPGDLFELGAHRLLCGDSTRADDVARLLGNEQADLLFTSPPYNVGINYDSHDDAVRPREEYLVWLQALLGVWVTTLRDGRAVIWNVGASPKTAPHRHVAMMEAIGLLFLRQFVWRKTGVPIPTFHMCRRDPRARGLTSNYTHEMVFVMGKGDLAKGATVALDDLLEHDVFELHQSQATVDIPTGDQRTGSGKSGSGLNRRSMKAHPAAFPVRLPRAFLSNYAAVGERVLEPFCGSGSTIIAGEEMTRAVCAMEVSPQYCQVTIDRWEAFTGKKAAKVSDGQHYARRRPVRRARTP